MMMCICAHVFDSSFVCLHVNLNYIDIQKKNAIKFCDGEKI